MKKKLPIEKRLLIIIPVSVILFIYFVFISFSRQSANADISNIHIQNPTIDPSNYITDAKAAISQAANGSLFNQTSNTATFDYPNQYSDYYNWAKTNLFNNKDYWTINSSGTQPVPNLVSFQKTASTDHINNGGTITYTITATYTGSDSIIITDTIPDNTTLIGNPSGNFSRNGTSIIWRLKDNQSGTSQDYKFTFTVQTTSAANDTAITNTAYATLEAGQTGTINWLYSGADLNPSGKDLGGSQFVITATGVNHPEWISSQCSGASMAYIFDAYKPNLKLHVADVLEYERSIGEWDPINGSHSINAITKSAQHFGFNAVVQQYPPTTASVQTLIGIAQNKKNPIMYGTSASNGVSHWMVLWGADSTWQSDPNGAHIWTLDPSGDYFTFDPSYPSSDFGATLTNKKISLTTFLAHWVVQATRQGGTIPGIVITPQ